VLTEATAVLPEGRISPQDLGIWMDDYIEAICGADPPRRQHPDGCGGDDHISRSGRAHPGYRQADAVMIARELLRDPYLPLRAARDLGQSTSWSVQYLRPVPEGSQAHVPVDLKDLESCFEEQHAS